MENLSEHLEEVQRKISYYFENLDLLSQAFKRSSFSTQYGGENNEVLEFIGDKVLDMFVTKVISDRFGFMKSQLDSYDEDNDLDEFCIISHKNEGELTELKKEIVSNKTLARRIDDLGFMKYLYLGDSDLENNVISQEKVKADLFEAILGAIAIDSNWDPDLLQNSVEFMLKIEEFLVDVDTKELRPQTIDVSNAINILKELSEHGVCSIPEYVISNEQVLVDGKEKWECTCFVRSWALSKTCYATSKKEAKKYSTYLVLCDYYGLSPKLNEEE